MFDKPISQKLPVARCYGTYVINGNTTRFNSLAFLPLDVYLVMAKEGFMSGMVAIPALP